MATTEASARTDYKLGFTSQDEETSVDRLPVTGELPDWLTGALVRVTPALLEVGGRRLDHWFDGVAMLNRFGFADGKVSYGSRFLESTAYQDAKEGEWRHGGFATDPCRSIFKRVQQIFSPDITDNPNVNLARIGERYIAMTETPMPVEFDPETLDTIGHLEYADKLKAHVTTAHPHHDVARNELVNYTARFSRVSEYVLYGLPADSSTRRVIARMPVKEPAYMHAFGMSERYLILAEYPLRANPLKLAFSGKPFIENYTWRADEPTRFRVFDRATGELRGTYDTDAFFCFHHVNAFERGGELVIDLCAYEDASVIDSLYLDDAGPKGVLPPVELRRYTLDLDGGGVRWEPLADGLARAAADRLRPPQHPRLLVRVLHRLGRELDRPAREGGRPQRHQVGVARRRLLSRRAGLRPRAGQRGRGRRRGAVGGARRERRPLVPAGARRRLLRGGRARGGAAPHPVRLPRPVLPMTELLASDADRERVAERLRAAAGDGRLTPAELEERLEVAFSARTDAELEPLVADLPVPPRPPRPRDRTHERTYVAVMLLLVAIWALTGAGYFWPIWPMLGWGIGVLADAGRLGRPCRRRSSNPGSSTARSPSSAAVAPGSGEQLR